MKKILAMMLTAAMMLSMGTAAMAEIVDPNSGKGEGSYVDEPTVQFEKTYNKVGDDAAESPAETFSFSEVEFLTAEKTGVEYTEAWAKENVPTIDSVSYTLNEAGSDTATKAFTITLPDYVSVGVYTYKFTETDNNTAGVKYDLTEMRLVVTVIEQSGLKRVAAVYCQGEGGEKVDEFENTYSAGNLEINKTVTGVLGDMDKYFEVVVTFTAPTGDTVKSDIDITGGSEHTAHDADCYESVLVCEEEHDHTEECYEDKLVCVIPLNPAEVESGWTGEKAVKIYVKSGDTVKFDNIPYGVTYTVVETEANQNGYTTTYTLDTATVTEVKSEIGETTDTSADDKVVITNEKDGEVDTGISVDSIPYIAMLGVVAIGGTGIIVSKKRRSED